MTLAEYIENNKSVLKVLDQYDLKITDYKRLDIFKDYLLMSKLGYKKMYILELLSDKYSIGVSTIKKLINLLSKELYI